MCVPRSSAAFVTTYDCQIHLMMKLTVYLRHVQSMKTGSAIIWIMLYNHLTIATVKYEEMSTKLPYASAVDNQYNQKTPLD